MKNYLLVIWGDVEPKLLGPFDTPEERDQKAREIRKEEGDNHGIYALQAEGKVEVDAYSGAFFDENEEV